MFSVGTGQIHEMGVICGDCLRDVVVGRIEGFVDFLDVIAAQVTTEPQEKKGSVDK
jgi:hypothetical protein